MKYLIIKEIDVKFTCDNYKTACKIAKDNNAKLYKDFYGRLIKMKDFSN